MSLINQMLKDLESRRQQENHSEHKVAVAPCYQKPQRHGALFIVALLIVLVGSCFVGWWYLISKPQVQPGVVAQASSSSSVGQSVGEPVVPVAPAQNAERIGSDPVSKIAAAVQLPSALVLPELKAKAEPVVTVPPVSGQRVPELEQQSVETQPVVPVSIAVVEPVPSKAPKPTAVVQVLQPVPVEEKAQQIRVQAQRLLEQHQYSEAVTLLHRAITMAGATAVQWHQLAVASLQARQLAAACQAADAGCEQYAHDVPLRVLQARLLLETGNRQQALAALHRVEPAPAVASASEYYALLATVQQQSGDFAAAQKNYTLLSEAFPDRGEWWIGRAICAEQSGHHGDASAHYQQALRCPQLPPQLKQYALQQLQRLAKG